MSTKVQNMALLPAYGFICLAAGAAFAIGAFAAIRPTTVGLALFLALFYLAAGVFYAINHEDRVFLGLLFVCGFAVRVLAAFILYFAYPPDGHVFRDDLYYMRTGLDIIEYWRSGGSPFHLDAYRIAASSRNWGYSLYNALHSLMIPSHLFPSVSNCFAGAMLALYVYRLAFKFFGKRVARISSMLVAAHSGMILYSSVNLKDMLVTLFVVMVLFYGAQANDDRRWINSLLKMVLCSVVLFSLRFYLAPLVLVVVTVYWTANVGIRLHRALLLLCTLALCVVFLASIMPGVERTLGEIYKSGGIVEALSHYSGKNLIKIGAKEHRAIGALIGSGSFEYLFAFVWFLLNPNPLNCHDITLLLIPGVVLWYALLPFFFTGVAALIREKPIIAILFAGYSFIITILYSTLPHLGNMRHRLPLEAMATVVATWLISGRLRQWHKVFALFVWTIMLLGMVYAKIRFNIAF